MGDNHSPPQSFKKARPGTLAQTVEIGLDAVIAGELNFTLRDLGTEKSNSTPRGSRLRGLIGEKAISRAGLWIKTVEAFSKQLAGVEPSFRGLVKSVTRTPKDRKEFAETEQTASGMAMERVINKTRTTTVWRRERALGMLAEKVKRKRETKQWGVGVPVGGVSKERMERERENCQAQEMPITIQAPQVSCAKLTVP